MRRTRMEQYDKEEVQPSSCCYCIIPWPCPSGKSPRTPQVPQLLNGKPIGTLRFTFNQLSHFLRLICYCWSVPLSFFICNLSWKGKSYSDRWSSVACFLPTLRYTSSVPRGPLGGLSTSSSGTQAACALGEEITFHSLREMTPEFINGPLKRRSAKCYLSLSSRDDAGIY
jgi:hypothetical protein